MQGTDDRLSQQVAFINEVERLKLIYRRNKTIDQARYENSAEHSWHVTLMTLVLAEHANETNIDFCRVMKMLLVHDLVEIYAGDTWLYDNQAVVIQAENEAIAASKLFGLLPSDQATELHQLWREFAAGMTPEAAFAGAVDGLQPLLNHLLSGSPDAQDVTLSRQEVLRRKHYIEASSKALWNVAQEVIEASTNRGLYQGDLHSD